MDAMTFEPRVFGVLLEYPDQYGLVQDLAPFIARAHDAGVLVAVGTDLLALALLTPPGEMGADVVYGNSQRFGVPLGYGGPHAAFFATRHAFVRQTPGRIIGVSVDVHGRRAYRMALATREQHIRREKATSNICTAQALLANMAAMYAVYHGPDGLKAIAGRVHTLTRILEDQLRALGVTQTNAHYFDTLRLEVPSGVDAVRQRAVEAGINFRYIDDKTIGISLNETVTTADVQDIVTVFAAAAGKPAPEIEWVERRAGPAGPAGGGAPDDGVHDASGVQHASLGDADDAVHPQPRAEGHRARHVDDPARLLHDEAECGHRDAAR